MSEQNSRTLFERLFNACLLILGSVLLLWLALHLLAQFWGWLLLIITLAAITIGVIWVVRWQLDRRW